MQQLGREKIDLEAENAVFCKRIEELQALLDDGKSELKSAQQTNDDKDA